MSLRENMVISSYGDKAYANDARRREAQAAGTDWRVSCKGRRGRKLTCADQAFNRKSNRTRARVEHVFGMVKSLWGYRQVRYRGLDKNATQVFTLLALANFYKVRHPDRPIAKLSKAAREARHKRTAPWRRFRYA